MDAFGDDFTGVSEVADVDPAAEFLAREHDQLAGLEDLIPEVAQPEQVETIQDDFMTENAFEVQASEVAVNYEVDAFAEVEVDNGLSNQLSGMGLKENGYSAPQMTSSIPREEPEKIRKWREEQKLRLEKKDEEEERKKQEMKEAARKELEDWYKHHKEAIEKTRSANRTAEKELIGTPTEMEPGQEWERIAKLCDFNPKASRNSKDVSRMRSIILQLKQNPSVAAAGH